MTKWGIGGITRFGPVSPFSLHQGAEEDDRSCKDPLIADELPQGDQHVLAVIDPDEKDPPNWPSGTAYDQIPFLIFILFARIYILYDKPGMPGSSN